ncbi:hypothetical protein CONCODRAFT_13077 [Conidiobolus coronatus NRRL 28638]|uniref:Uncharacterized protein n=1 Tax=Conidiobolus coronatus (strain ATCC 28846 / CBS 209.66 / NRRL 28638) TaxID=796925 RepID=A0A137NRP9_CONC2|nr:hypothetical protein CONCODRAFT_13077 [Conidiobolus coronatus NRRL 28638]|eukprot:KXN65360.1 hypothetical protein CONCODRAFT_13077 [Conidiobolus coronatus NRRL 28638]
MQAIFEASVQWFNTLTYVNRTDKYTLAENRLAEFEACLRCVAKCVINLLNTHHISIGVVYCLLWGIILYTNNSLGYDAYLDGQIVPQSMQQNLSTKCGRYGVVPNSTNMHGVTCLASYNKKHLVSQ